MARGQVPADMVVLEAMDLTANEAVPCLLVESVGSYLPSEAKPSEARRGDSGLLGTTRDHEGLLGLIGPARLPRRGSNCFRCFMVLLMMS